MRIIFSRLSFLFLLICSIFVLSCKKDTDSSTQRPIAPVSTDSVLSKIIWIGIDGIPSDTSITQTYFYDAQNRVIKLIDSSKNTTVMEEESVTTYSYHNNDTLPFIRQEILWNWGSIPFQVDTTTTYFLYDTQGRKIADSTIGASNQGSGSYTEEIHWYQYAAGKIYGKWFFNGYDLVTPFTSSGFGVDTAVLDSRGNIISNVRYEQGVPYPKVTTSSFTWDNNPSPFAQLSIFKTFDGFPRGDNTDFYNFPQKNNFLHVVEIGVQRGITTISHESYDYTGLYSYNAYGLPTQITAPDPSNPGVTARIIFLYKAK